MGSGRLPRDQNRIASLGGESTSTPGKVVAPGVDESTDRLLVQAIIGGQINPIVDYDYLDVQQTDTDTETYIFKLGGAGGATVRTIVVNYTSSSKSDIDNVSWS